MPKIRKIPQRTCLGCRSIRAKREMLRIVRTSAGEVALDPTGKKSGRGTYVCPTRECLEKVFKDNRLEKALEIRIEPAIREALQSDLDRLIK